MNVIKAQSIDIKPKTSITLPLYTKFLSINLDHRFNNVQIWMLQDDEKDAKTENVDILMIRADDALEVVNAKYIGQMKDAAGWLHVFAIRDSEKLPFQK